MRLGIPWKSPSLPSFLVTDLSARHPSSSVKATDNLFSWCTMYFNHWSPQYYKTHWCPFSYKKMLMIMSSCYRFIGGRNAQWDAVKWEHWPGFSCFALVHAVAGRVQVGRPEEAGKQWVAECNSTKGINMQPNSLHVWQLAHTLLPTVIQNILSYNKDFPFDVQPVPQRYISCNLVFISEEEEGIFPAIQQMKFFPSLAELAMHLFSSIHFGWSHCTFQKCLFFYQITNKPYRCHLTWPFFRLSQLISFFLDC